MSRAARKRPTDEAALVAARAARTAEALAAGWTPGGVVAPPGMRDAQGRCQACWTDDYHVCVDPQRNSSCSCHGPIDSEERRALLQHRETRRIQTDWRFQRERGGAKNA